MARTKKGKPRCPEGHKCDFCGGKARADHSDAKHTDGRRQRTKEVDPELAYYERTGIAWLESE